MCAKWYGSHCERPIRQLICLQILLCISCLVMWGCKGGGEADLGELVTATYLPRHPRELTFEPLSWELPRPHRVALENGLVIYVMEDHSLPHLKFTAFVRAGSIFDPLEEKGLANLTAATMRSGGSSSMSADDSDEALEFSGTMLAVDCGYDLCTVKMWALKEHAEESLRITAELIMNPAFPAERMRDEMSRAIEHIRRMEDRPSALAKREFRRLIYGEHPYGFPAAGSCDSISKITREDLVQFHNAHYFSSSVIIGISGDFTADRMVKMVEEAFGKWRDCAVARVVGPHCVRDYGDFKARANPGIFFLRKDVTQASIVLGHLGVARTTPDYFAIKLLNFILGGGGFSSRLTEKVRSDMGLAYGIRSDFTFLERAGLFYVSTDTKSSTAVEAIRTILREIETVRERGVTQEELDRAKEFFINSRVFLLEDVHNVVEEYMEVEFYGLSEDCVRRFTEKVRGVSLEDVQAAARRHIRPDELTILVVGDEEVGEQLKELGEVKRVELPVR